jgi:hypothetical protein
MKAVLLLFAAFAVPLAVTPAHAAWEWDAPMAVSAVHSATHFPHLESANRQGVTVSDGAVGVVWEDSRAGRPQCYLAIKPVGETAFQAERRVSEGECYEPVVEALGNGRFVVAWEEDSKVWGRVVPDGAPVQLSSDVAAQVTLATEGKRVFAAWAEQAGRYRRIVVARLGLQGNVLKVASRQPVEAQPPVDDQAWPALAAFSDGRITVAWEDRRHRHTVPMASTSAKALRFDTPVRLTDHKSGSVGGLGAGMGAMRPTLARVGERVVAAWLDKRDFLSGYDVYAAFDDGAGRFGRNARIQDSFGDNVAQWHAKIVAHAQGRVVAVWDDARDGTPDVWMAEWDGAAFGDNVAVPGAYGPGAQAHPVATLDEAGALHVVWLDDDAEGRVQIRYARGVVK